MVNRYNLKASKIDGENFALSGTKKMRDKRRTKISIDKSNHRSYKENKNSEVQNKHKKFV